MPRPRKKIEPEKVKQLASLGLSNEEIAAVLECSHDTIERRFKKEMRAGRDRRNASLKRKQYEVAMAGNATMLIWLGKQYLDQSDKLEVRDPEEVADPKDKLRKFIAGARRPTQE